MLNSDSDDLATDLCPPRFVSACVLISASQRAAPPAERSESMYLLRIVFLRTVVIVVGFNRPSVLFPIIEPRVPIACDILSRSRPRDWIAHLLPLRAYERAPVSSRLAIIASCDGCPTRFCNFPLHGVSPPPLARIDLPIAVCAASASLGVSASQLNPWLGGDNRSGRLNTWGGQSGLRVSLIGLPKWPRCPECCVAQHSNFALGHGPEL
jgi:hypothetical protein